MWLGQRLQAQLTGLDTQAARERSIQIAKERGWEEIERRRPLPDPQDTGLMHGSKKQ